MSNNIGSNIRQKRKLRDLDQKELAKYTGLSPTLINFFEKGTKVPSLNALIAIADVLNCSLDELCGRSA